MIQKLIVLVLLIPFKLLSGVDSVITTIVPNNQILKTYSDGKIITNNYEKILATNIKIYKNFAVFTDINKRTQKLDYKDILLISAKTGNFAVEGAILGALGGLILPLAYDRNRLMAGTYNFNAEPLIYSTVICAGLGCLIGVLTDDYDTICQNGVLFLTFNDKQINSLRNTNNLNKVAIHLNLYFN